MLAGCAGQAHPADTTPKTTSAVSHARMICEKAERELEVIIRHGVPPEAAAMKLEMERAMGESMPVLNRAITELRGVKQDGELTRVTENNRLSLMALADELRRRPGIDSAALPPGALKHFFSSDSACVRG
jgi:hypothetical protein